jgi:hypothetical protein
MAACHGYTGGVSNFGGPVMANPQVIAIYWGPDFDSEPGQTATVLMNQFVNDLVASPYIGGLAQYGVGLGTLEQSVFIDNSKYPLPATLTNSDIQIKLGEWFMDQETDIMRPDLNKLYLLIPSNTTLLDNNGDVLEAAGYHSSSAFFSPPGDNVVWAVINYDKGLAPPPSGTSSPQDNAAAARKYVDFFSAAVAHELVEAFSNPTGSGFYFLDHSENPPQSCEIGDLGEQAVVGLLAADGTIVDEPFLFSNILLSSKWRVEPYWSQSAGRIVSPGWNGWIRLGGLLKDDPAVTVLSNGRHEIYVRGANDRLFQKSWAAGSQKWFNGNSNKWFNGVSWNPLDDDGSWVALDGGFPMGSGPSVITAEGDVRHIFVRGADGAVYHNYLVGLFDQSLKQWEPLGGLITGAPAAVYVGSGVIDVYARGLDDRLYQRWWDGAQWNPTDRWYLHDDGAFRLASSPAVIAWGDNQREVYAQGTDGAVWTKSFDGASWGPWNSLDGGIKGAPSVVSVNTELRADLYVRGWDDQIWQKWRVDQDWYPGTLEWTQHQDGGFQLGSSPAVVAYGTAFRGVYASDPNGVLFFKYWDVRDK